MVGLHIGKEKVIKIQRKRPKINFDAFIIWTRTILIHSFPLVQDLLTVHNDRDSYIYITWERVRDKTEEGTLRIHLHIDRCRSGDFTKLLLDSQHQENRAARFITLLTSFLISLPVEDTHVIHLMPKTYSFMLISFNPTYLS